MPSDARLTQTEPLLRLAGDTSEARDVMTQATSSVGDSTQLPRLEAAIRHCLDGRPIPFSLSLERGDVVISAVVPTFYSKQLLLRAAQRASAPLAVRDRICVPFSAWKPR
jgi:hypothetical protein